MQRNAIRAAFVGRDTCLPHYSTQRLSSLESCVFIDQPALLQHNVCVSSSTTLLHSDLVTKQLMNSQGCVALRKPVATVVKETATFTHAENKINSQAVHTHAMRFENLIITTGLVSLLLFFFFSLLFSID